MKPPAAFVVEAELTLSAGCDPAAVGAAVTTALCGHWEHAGPCYWPHNSAIDTARDPALFRAIFVASPDDERSVRERVEHCLQSGEGWRVRSKWARAVLDTEQPLATRLLSGPRANEPLARDD